MPRAVSLSLPLIAFLLIQTAAGLAAIAIVGRVGTGAVAGMGIASAVYGLLLALLFGVDTAVQAMVARATGAGAPKRAGQILTNALVLSAALGSALSLAAFAAGSPLVSVLAPIGTVDAGASYLRAAAPSLFFLSLTIPMNAYWIASGRPGIAFGVSAVTAPLQICLTAILVLGESLGTKGAGLAIAFATLAGAGLQALLALHVYPVQGLGQWRARRENARAIATLGWPISVQQSLAQLAVIVSFAIVARLGATPAAVANVLLNLSLVPVQIATGLGMAAATLVGQLLGRNDENAARRQAWRIAAWAFALLGPLGLVAALAPAWLASLFLIDAGARTLAIWPFEVIGLAVGADAAWRILAFALRGAGATKSSSGIAFVAQWFLQLPLMWLVGLRLHYGFDGIVVVQAVVAIVSLGAYGFVWKTGRWAHATFFMRTEPRLRATSLSASAS